MTISANTASAAHTSFVIERDFAASPQAVFLAWADPDAKRSWSDCHAEHTTQYSLDFSVYGRETHRVVYPDGKVQYIEKVFFDIVPSQRIVFSYDINLDGKRLSVSLVTVDFIATRTGTHMAFTEQLVYLDGHEDREQRIRGTEEGLDRLGHALLKRYSASLRSS
jgi:uncharacterized protein YndB with AHSA1/START domain